MYICIYVYIYIYTHRHIVVRGEVLTPGAEAGRRAQGAADAFVICWLRFGCFVIFVGYVLVISLFDWLFVGEFWLCFVFLLVMFWCFRYCLVNFVILFAMCWLFCTS